MVIGYLALGILGALVSAIWALMAGYGLLAAFGFYVLGGSLALTAAACAAAFTHPVHRQKLIAAKI